MGRVVVNGVGLEYVERGRGIPVVFVHGGLSDWRQWEPQLASFGAKHRAISYSRRGHWPNAPLPPGEADTILDNAEDLAGFLRAVDAAPAHLVGNSWGAYSSLYCAVKRPDVVRSLILEEPAAIPLVLDGPPGPESLERLARRDPAMAQALGVFFQQVWMPCTELFRRGDDEAAWRLFVTNILGGTRFFEALPPGRVAQMRANVGPLKAEFLSEDALTPITEADVLGVRAPTLLVTGEHSPPFLRLISRRLEKLLPRAEALDVPGVSHIAHEQDPATFELAALAFLARQS